MFDLLHHFFIPHHRNNHRSRLLYNSSLFLIILFFLFASLFTFLVNKTHPEVLGISYSISDTELLTLVNAERQKMGLSTLNLNPELSDAARRKAADMFEKNYWAHFSPDGSTSPWNFIKASGYSYTFAGENLAKGFTDANSTVVAWMNSPTHRDNILSDKYRDVGFAIVPGTLNGEETVLVVEMFGARPQSTVADAEEETEPEEVQPQLVAAANNESEPAASSPAEQVASSSPIINAQVTSRAASTVGLSFLAFAFIMDLVIVERKKIPRIVGHNLDHIMLILLFILFVVLAGSGVVL